MRLPMIGCLAALLVPAALGAQAKRVQPPLLSDPAVRACVAGLRSADYEPAIVHVSVDPVFGELPAAQQAANLLASDVALRVRERLGAPEGTVPNAESRLPWTAVWGSVHLALRGDGTLARRATPMRTAGDSLASEGSALLLAALDTAIAQGDRWPYVGLSDSTVVEFALHFSFADRVDDPPAPSSTPRVLVPVFTHRLPMHRSTRWVRGTVEPKFPPAMRRYGVQAIIGFEVPFAADGTLRPAGIEDRGVPDDPASARNLVIIPWAALETGPPVREANPEERTVFLAAIRDILRRTRAEPGRIGPCTLGDRLEGTVLFALAGRRMRISDTPP